MTTFALLSALHRLDTSNIPDLHIIIDDGDWSEAQITSYINLWAATSPDPLPAIDPPDWANPEPLA